MKRLMLMMTLAGATLACLNFSRCGNNRFETIDTVAFPVASVVRKIAISEPYFNERIREKTKELYQASDYKILWLDRKRPSRLYNAFVEEVRASLEYGMNPVDYQLDDLDKQVKVLYDSRPEDEAIANLDMRITATFFLFTTHLLEGRIRKPGQGDFIWKKLPAQEDDVKMLTGIKSAGELKKELKNLHPDDDQYQKLTKALAVFNKRAGRKQRPIRIQNVINPGDSDVAIPAIRARLAMTGNVKEKNVTDSLLYDADLVQAVNGFKETFGLPHDGMIDNATAQKLNIPLEDLAEIVALNLERLRWQPRPFTAPDEIVVNIPEYMLRVYHNNKPMLTMKVILGSEFNATPVFHDTLKYIVFSPTWNVPASIIENEFWPVLKEDPEHYSAQGFTFYKNGEEIDPSEEKWDHRKLNITEYSVVQSPSADNALGHVKFVMPNNFNIYLHDTPADRLFGRDERALSHGCIRLEKPVELAKYLLQDQKEWDEKSITSAMGTEKPITVHVTRPYVVHIVYRTAWVDENDRINFREDIYGHDKRQLNQLTRLKPLSASR